MIEKEVVGQLVLSKAGRDKGRIFVLYEIIDAEYVTIVDGDLRKVDAPKKKKKKHLAFMNENVFEDASFQFTNKKLRAKLQERNKGDK